MRYQTHVVTSLTAAVVLTQYTELPLTVTMLAGTAIGALIPDIDEPESKIGRKTPGVSHATKFAFGHRGITHSLLAVALFAWLLTYIGLNLENHFVFGLCLGYLLHILGDALSKSGVPLLKPFKNKRYGIPIYETGGIREKIIFGLTTGYLVYFIYVRQLWEHITFF